MKSKKKKMKKEKKRVEAKTVLPSTPIKELEEPPLHKVVTKIVADDEAFIPKYQTEGSVCVDLVANIPQGEQDDLNPAESGEIRLQHRATVMIDCGFSMGLKPGWKANISARSGWASKGLVVTNGPGKIDHDYTGRIKVIVTNVGQNNPIVIKHLDRIAQMEIEPVYQFEWEVVESLEETKRGAGGFGSTGLNVQ